MTTRDELLEQYELNEAGLIRSPGKFEGEPIYVPYFWDKGLEGCADYDSGPVFGFEVDTSDLELFPELEGITVIALEESDSGFVCCNVEYESIAELESDCDNAE